MTLVPVLTPHGALVLRHDEDAVALEPAPAARLAKAFARGDGHGLLSLGADEPGTGLPALFSYWREFGTRYITALCALPGIGESTATARVLADDDVAALFGLEMADAVSSPAPPAPEEGEHHQAAPATQEGGEESGRPEFFGSEGRFIGSHAAEAREESPAEDVTTT